MNVVLFLAKRQLLARKGLNGIAILGVTLGVVMLIGITGIMHGFQSKFLALVLKVSPHVVVFDKKVEPDSDILSQTFRSQSRPFVAKVYRQPSVERPARITRPEETRAKILSLEGVAGVSGVLVGSAVVSVGSKTVSVEVRGIEMEVQETVTPLLPLVVRGNLSSLGGAIDGVMIGATLAKDLGVDVGDSILCSSATTDRSMLRIVAVFASGMAALDKGRIYVPSRVGQSVLGRTDRIERIEIRLKDPERAPELTTTIENLLGYDAESWQETNANMLAIFQQQNSITGMMIAAVLLVGGFGILAIQIMIVLEKTRDIALLKAVGYSGRSILGIFLLQGGIVAFLGSIAGAVLGHGLLEVLRRTPAASSSAYVKPENFAIHETIYMYIAGFSFALMVGLLASVIPAWRASRVEPVDVLRGLG